MLVWLTDTDKVRMATQTQMRTGREIESERDRETHTQERERYRERQRERTWIHLMPTPVTDEVFFCLRFLLIFPKFQTKLCVFVCVCLFVC